MGFKENLRYYREKAGYKQAKDFVKVLDIPYNTYTAYENQGREPKFKTLCKISKLLNVSIDTLLTGEDKKISTNDNKQLKEEINKILSISDKEFLKLIDIDKDFVTFYLCDDEGTFITEGYLSKNAFIETINHIKSDVANYFKIRMYHYIIGMLITIQRDILNDELKKITDNPSNNIKEEVFKTQDIICTIIKLSELAETWDKTYHDIKNKY